MLTVPEVTVRAGEAPTMVTPPKTRGPAVLRRPTGSRRKTPYFGADLESYRLLHSARIFCRLLAAHAKSFFASLLA